MIIFCREDFFFFLKTFETWGLFTLPSPREIQFHLVLCRLFLLCPKRTGFPKSGSEPSFLDLPRVIFVWWFEATVSLIPGMQPEPWVPAALSGDRAQHVCVDGIKQGPFWKVLLHAPYHQYGRVLKWRVKRFLILHSSNIWLASCLFYGNFCKTAFS